MNYSPALQYFKFPIKSGDSWISSSTETNVKTGKTRTHTLNGNVGGLEQVTVPAGTFRAFRITIQSELNDSGQISTGQDISWYSPDVRRTVMSELESRDSTGKIGRRTVNLISYRLGTSVKSVPAEKKSIGGKPAVQRTPVQMPLVTPIIANPQPVPTAVAPKAVASAKTLDQDYNERITAECPQGFFPALACREKIRWKVCDGKWSPNPAPGQVTCQASSATTGGK